MKGFARAQNLKCGIRTIIALIIVVVMMTFNLFAMPVRDTNLRQEIVFIDSGVNDIKVLEDGIRPEAEVIILNSDKDSVKQMAEALTGRHDIAAIHIISHGEPGKLLLGNITLSNENINKYDKQFKAIGKALTQDGDILIYGCNVAKDEEGINFVNSLAKATGADVAASTDATGALEKGGNWVLEYAVGKINISSPFIDTVLKKYNELLETVTIVGGDIPGDNASSFNKTIGGQTFTFIPPTNAWVDVPNPTINGFYGLYMYDGDTADATEVTIAAPNGYTFDMSELQYISDRVNDTISVTLTFADNSTDTKTYTMTANSNVQTLNSFTTAINDVKKVKLACPRLVYYNNFIITDVKLIPTSSLAYAAGDFTEAATNNGAITTTKTVTLSGTDTFVAGPFVAATHYTVANVPAGLTLVATRDSTTQVTLSLTGTATAHANANDASNLTITFLNAAFSGGDATAVSNYSKNNMVIDFADPPVLTYAAGTFTEVAANNGTITTTKTVTLAGDTFVATNPFVLNTHYTVANVPAGMTLSVARDSGTQLTLSLTGTATNHNNANDATDLTISFQDAAFTNALAAGITNSTKSNMAIDFNNPTLTYAAGTFTEVAANNGTITTTKTVTLAGDTFVAANPFVLDTHYTVANVPAGMTLSVARDSGTQVTLSLTGTASAHENANDATNLTITFLNAAFTGNNASIVTNYSKNDMAIDFADAPVLTYAAGTFTEVAANNGTITTTKTVTLTGDTFVATNPFVLNTHYTVANVPAGMTLSVARDSGTQLTLSLTGTATNHNNANDATDLTISFQDAAFTNALAAGVTNSTKSNMAIDFNNPTLTYAAGTFTEAAANNGTITTTKTVTLAGDTFVAANPFVLDTHYTVANVPAGMTLSVARDSGTQVTLSLTGTASAHENANDATNLTITFLNAAFTGNNASIVTNYSKNDMAIDFADAPVLTYAAGTFTEAAANNGTITTTKTVTLTGDTFVATNPFVLNTHYTVANVPAGMTLSVARDSGTQLTLSLTGTATNHNNANDATDLTISFQDAAFTVNGAAAVTNSTKNNMAIDFNNPALTYAAGTFTEVAANNGTITTTKTVTLAGDTFVAANPFVLDTHYTVANVPAGMTLSVARDSGTQVTLSLTGTASAHENANDATNLTITFLNAAFTGNNASIVTNYSKNDMAIDFTDAPTLTYAAGTFTEAAANDGTITTTKTVTLAGDTFVATNPFVLNTHYTVANVPAGMTLSVARDSGTQLTLSLTGTATNHNNANDATDLTISFQDAAFTNALAAGVTNSTKSNMAIDFNNPTLTYAAGTFTEVAANNGTITTTKTVTLAGDTFVAANPFVLNTHYTVANVPTGMTLVVARNSGTQVTLSLTGTASAHENANDATNLTITFQNAAFTGNNASIVTNYSKNDMAIDFADAPVLTYAAGTFTEAAANNGTITTTKTVTLTGDTFVAANPFVLNTHYTVANVPAGMTLAVSRDSNTQVTLSLTGTAAAHDDTNSISNLTISFQDAAFTVNGAAAVINATKSDMQVTFTEPPVVGGSGTITAGTATSSTIDLSWTAATDTATAQTNLQYKVVRSASSNITSATDAEANGTTVMDWTANTVSKQATGLSASTTYYFNVIVKDEAGNKVAYTTASKATIAAASHHNDNPTTPPAPTPTVITPTPVVVVPPTPTAPTITTTVTQVIVNDQVQNAGTTTTQTVDNVTTTTVTVDDNKINQKLNTEGQNSTVTIPIGGNSDVAVGELNGQTVKNMETKEAVLEIKTDNVTYTLPASEINIDNVSSQIGEQVALKDIKISVTVAAPSQDTVKIVQDTANRNSYQVVVKPIDFEISCTSGSKTVDVSKFNGYVERTVAIPDGVDPSKITTGIVLNKDGTFSHVPTSIIVIGGKYYAKINSLTNSTYSIIWSPKKFVDAENNWAKDAINDMGSRLVINGIDDITFAPSRDITRAEVASIVIKGMGLMRTGTGKDVYKDVSKTDWYYDAVSIANDYGLIKGTGKDKFEPNRKITRQEVMTIMERALELTKVNTNLSITEIEKQLNGYEDKSEIKSWAKKSVAVCINSGVIVGKGENIKALDNITRAEVATIIKRFLQKAKLI